MSVNLLITLLFPIRFLENHRIQQLHILLTDHETATGQVGDMRVVADTQATRQPLDVLFNRESWCAPRPDVGATSGALGKIHDTEFLDELFVLYFLPELLRQSLLVDVEEEKS